MSEETSPTEETMDEFMARRSGEQSEEQSSQTEETKQVEDQQVEPDESDQQTDDTEASKEKSEEESEDKSKRQNRRRARTQRHISKLTREAQEAKEEAAYLRGQLEAVQGKSQPDKQPDRDDFESYDEWVDALTDWKLDQRLKAQQETPKDKGESQPPEPQVNEKAAAFHQQGYESYGEDFIAAMQDDSLTVTQVMADTIVESESGPDLYMYLSDNPAEARRIANLSIPGQIREIDKLGEKIQGASEPPQEKPKRTSNAPPPVNPERSSGEMKSKDLEDIQNIDEWMAVRNRTKRTL